MAIAVTASSCLITQPVHFDEPANSPPAIDTDGALFPLNELIRAPESSDGGVSPTTTTIDFNVYDPDVDQPLQFKVFVDGNPLAATERPIPVSTGLTGRDRRRASFPLPDFGLTAGCHRVELLVSSQFAFGSRLPMIDHDIASATWWVYWRPSTDVSMRACP